MIFATVGTQLPFPRLMDALDAIAARHGIEIFAQTGYGGYVAKHMETAASLDPATFSEKVAAARLIVGHAGMGTILTARKAQKPAILMPRIAAKGEHRNEHQRATAAQMQGVPGYYIAEDAAALEALILRGDLVPAGEQESPARQQLIARLREFIAAG
ncbi:glycosyltransferase [Paracoccaceae bacterium GXU_MW_L88]